MAVEDAIAMCSDAEPLADTHDAICAVDEAPGFCTLDYENFTYHMAPVCMGEAALAHRANVLGLKPAKIDESLAELAAAGCGAGCALSIRTFTFPPFVTGTLAGVVGSVWSALAIEEDEEPASALHVVVPNEDESTLAIIDTAQALTGQPHPPTEMADLTITDDGTATGDVRYKATVIALLQSHIVVLVERRYAAP